MQLKDVLVTGGSGFIGRRLCQRLATQVTAPYRVVPMSSKDVDLANSTDTFGWWNRELRHLDVSHIFHLAAVYKAGGWPATHPATQFHLNMAINVNVLEAWKRYAPKARMASVVSYCMYPDHDQPHPETEMYGTEPEQYLYAYAFTKKALVIGQRAYCQEFGLSAVSAVLPTIYGPEDSFAEDSHVMGALIGKFCRAVDEGFDRVEVWGDGEQEREFLFVDDAVDGILAAADRGVSPCLNMGSGRAVSIRTLAEHIRIAVTFRGEIVYNPHRFVGARRRLLSNDLVAREIGWQPATDIDEGIRRTVAAYRAARGDRRVDASAGLS